MIISIPKEIVSNETRVALSPDTAANLIKAGHEIHIQEGSGVAASFPDKAYKEIGATIIPTAQKLYESAKVVIKVQPPTDEEIKMLQSGTVLISYLGALYNKDLVDKLLEAKVTALGIDAIPRITRAQKMDVLSSMSSIAGYKSVLIGANALGKYLPMMMTAAGTIPPAKVLVLGAGVAGLQAIATAHRLGAIVEAFDVRPSVKEQVESLGAKFVEVPLEEEQTETKGGYARELSEENKKKQQEVIHQHVRKSDVVITTALVPGKRAPLLITKDMVEDMMPGSVIVDLASEQGGNCELTEEGKVVEHDGVFIHGPQNVASMMPMHASQLFAKNVSALIMHLTKDNQLNLDFEDEITLNTTITHNGEIISPVVKEGEM